MATAYKYNKGIDYAFRPGNLSYSTLKMKGHSFIGRYIDGTVSTSQPNPKCITIQEQNSILAARLGIVYIFEKSATRSIPGSVGQATTNGTTDGLAANADMQKLGVSSPTIPIIVAAGDTDINSSNVSQAVAYWTAFDAACTHQCGVYGDFDLIQALQSVCPILWQANARGWSGAKLHPSAHVIQTSSYYGYDGNMVLRPFYFYSGNTDVTYFPSSYPYSLFDPVNKRWGSYPWQQNLPKLTKGSTGNAVKYLQGILRKTVAPTLPVNGTFGAQTYAAVVAFQNKYRAATYTGSASSYMVADGIVGGQTWGVISNMSMLM